MGHNYYSDNYDKGYEDRLDYFDSHFKILAEETARAKGITLSQYLSHIRNITTFKAILREVFSQDVSLSNYVDGMKVRDYQLFYDRGIIQDVVNSNLEGEPERIQEEIITEIPEEVRQEEKITKEYFKAMFTEYSTNKSKRTIAYRDEVTIKGKKREVYRDSKGKFAKRL